MNSVGTELAMPPIRVLVVDDEPGILESYKAIFEASPAATNAALLDLRAQLFGRTKAAPQRPQVRFDLVCCGGAEAAVRAVQSANAEDRPFAVVFLDMRMPPGPDGAWAAAEIRKLDLDIDIIIATAYSDIDPREIADQVGSSGSLFYLQKPFHSHEVRQLAHALGRRRQAENRIRQLAYFDELTGLPNRTWFKEHLSRVLQAGDGQPAAVMFLDLDNFKRVNDTLGHSIGDILLQEVSKRLLVNVRATDEVAHAIAGKRESLSRLGGDEFTVVLTALKEPSDAAIVASRLLEALSQPIVIGPHEITIGVSIGIATYPDDGTDVESLIKNADMAMYFAKHDGRNRYQFYTQAMQAAALKRLTIEQHLRRAIERGELFVHYQPQVDVRTGEVVGVETLARWNSAELGSVPPDEFIPIAEETGLILSIGEWVLRTAAAQCKAWHDQGIRLPRIAVNVSVHQFAQEGFVERVGAILQETGLDPAALELEITESLLMKHGEAAISILHALKGLGVQLAIDDFGTGYSSLSYLKQFPIDHLKIDRSFICSVASDAQDSAIANAIIAMGHNMQMRVSAEGVETDIQMSFLSKNHCDEAQGFLMSRPLPADHAADFLRRHLHRQVGAELVGTMTNCS